MDFHTLIGIVAGFLAFVSFIPYFNSILKGRTKPNRATFAIWSTVTIITVASYIASGARATIFVGLVYAVLQVAVFGLSLKYGVGGLNTLDIICLLGAAIGLILWIETKNPHTALYVGILVEVFGYIPTIKKSYLKPETEDTLAWSIAAIGAILNLFAVTTFRLDILAYPLYVVLEDGVTTLLLLFPNLRLSKVKQTWY